jgi:hypothetical protein
MLALRSRSALDVVSRRVRRLPKQMKKAGAALVTWRSKSERFVKKNPGRAVIGASALGFVIAKLKRFV